MLYKYVSGARTAFLQDRLLRFSQPGVFNDPFELHPHYQLASKADLERLPLVADQPEGPGPKLRQLTAEALSSMIDAVLPGLSRTVQTMQGPGVYALNTNLLARSTFDERYGILSMARVPHNLLMWAHYADCHRGFAIQFDEGHEFFTKLNEADAACRLADVEYSDDRPSLSYSNLHSPEIFLRKSTAWSYEREVRLIRPLAEATKANPVDGAGFAVCLFQVPPEAVTGIVLGACMPQIVQTEITALLAANSVLSHVQVFHMRLSSEKFELEAYPPLEGVPATWGVARVCEAR